MDESKKKVTAAEGEQEKTPDELADELAEATEKAGGRERMIERFGSAEVKLTKPFEWCGTTYTELHLDFGALTGRDMEAIDEEIGVMGLRGMVPAYSRMYQRLLAARAAKVPADMIEALPLADYNTVTGAAQNFLFVSG